MRVVVFETPRLLRSVEDRRASVRVVWFVASTAAFAFATQATRAQCDDRTPIVNSVDEEFANRRAVAHRASLLERDAFESASVDSLGDSSAAIQQAADIASSTFGERHWITRWHQPLAEGFKSLAELPLSQKELYLDSLNVQITGRRLATQGKHDLALKELRRAHEKRIAAIGPGHILTAYSLFGICADENRLGAAEIAKEHALALMSIAAEQWGKDHPAFASALRNLAWAECQLDEFQSAERHAQQVIAILEPIVVEGMSDTYYELYAVTHATLARARNDQGRYADAESTAQRAVILLSSYPHEMYLDTLVSLLEVARSESGQGKFTQAEITFTAFRTLQLKKFPAQFATSFKNGYDEHLKRVRSDMAREKDRQLKR